MPGRQLGDRAFDELRRRHFAALGWAVAAHGGEEVKNTGDWLMAVFPSAAEAVEAAVAMQQATARQSRSHPVAIWVGIGVGDATMKVLQKRRELVDRSLRASNRVP